jgi:hypothetical protein
MDLSGSGQGSVTGSREYGTEPLRLMRQLISLTNWMTIRFAKSLPQELSPT